VHGETVETFDDAAAVPNSRDVVIRAISEQAIATLPGVVYGDGSRLYLASRLPNTMWSNREIGRLSGVPNFDSDTAFVTLTNPVEANDFHLAWTSLAGTSAGFPRYERFLDPNNTAVDITQFLTPETPPFESVEHMALAVDRFGLRYLAAIDQGAGGALRVSLPREARDDDSDGLPLFMEHALCRNPSVADSEPILRAQFETTPDDLTELATLEYDRPSGLATLLNPGIAEVGIFRYELKNSTTLEFFGNLTIFNNVASYQDLPIGTSDIPGATVQRAEAGAVLSLVPRRFFRLKVEVRED
jgi:hypothetical protein